MMNVLTSTDRPKNKFSPPAASYLGGETHMSVRQLDGNTGSESLLRSSRPANDAKIMIVDDEPVNVKMVRKYLRDHGYTDFVTTSDSRQALDIIRREMPDMVLLDIVMPHISGLNILEVVRGDMRTHHLPVLILTAATDAKTKLAALELGATDLLTKPVDPTELLLRVRNLLVVKAHHDHMADYSTRLAHEVQLRTAELEQSRKELIHILACAAEYRDQETGNHVVRVGLYAGLITEQLGFSSGRVELIRQAATLHDVGKIGIPDAILRKPGKLDPAECEAMQAHCEYGLRILMGRPCRGVDFTRSSSTAISIHSPILKVAAKICISHHEKWDGSGYPLGLAGKKIPIEGRITAVADVFDALQSKRPYKEAYPWDKCCQILEEGRGSHFDPQVLDAFFARRDEIKQISRDLSDGHDAPAFKV